jgi:hypothetical protein
MFPITSFNLVYSFGPDKFVNGQTPKGYVQFQAVQRRLAFPAIERTARSMHISFAPVSLLYAFAPHSGLSALCKVPLRALFAPLSLLRRHFSCHISKERSRNACISTPFLLFPPRFGEPGCSWAHTKRRNTSSVVACAACVGVGAHHRCFPWRPLLSPTTVAFPDESCFRGAVGTGSHSDPSISFTMRVSTSQTLICPRRR